MSVIPNFGIEAIRHTSTIEEANLVTIDGLVPWVDEGNCLGADPELFTNLTRRDEAQEAKEYCRACPVAAFCLETGLKYYTPTDRFAVNIVWGGLTTNERQRILRKRNK